MVNTEMASEPRKLCLNQKFFWTLSNPCVVDSGNMISEKLNFATQWEGLKKAGGSFAEKFVNDTFSP